MNHAPTSVLAGTQAPMVEVRNKAGDLVGRVTMPRAEELIAAALVSPIGRNSIKYLVLNVDEPVLQRPWRGGSHTTERIRNEQGVIIAALPHVKHRDLFR